MDYRNELDTDEKVYYSFGGILDSDRFEVEWEDDDLKFRVGGVFISIPKQHIKRHRDEWRKLLAIVGDTLQDIDIMEGGSDED